MKKIITLFFAVFVLSQAMVAQNLKKINQLLDQKAYQEATELLLKIDNKSQAVLEKLGDSYFYTKNMPEAANWYKLLLEKYQKQTDPEYLYKYAQTLKNLGNYDEADTWYEIYSGKSFNTEEYLNTINVESSAYEVEKIQGNSSASDFAPAFFGDDIVFASSRGDGDIYKWTNQAYLDLYIGSIDENGNIVKAEPFSGTINTKLHEASAAFTKDGKTIYFTRNNKKAAKNKITYLKIYKASLVDEEWTNIEELPINGKNYSTINPALSNDEKQLYFASDMPGSSGSYDIYVVDINDGKFGMPKNLGKEINSDATEQFPFISSNNTLYFSSNRYEGFGGLDIFKATKDSSGKYTEATNLGGYINGYEDDFSFIINDDKNTGYFASNRDSALSDNIYKFNLPDQLFIRGSVKDLNASTLLPGTSIKIIDMTEVSSTIVTVGDDAQFSFDVQRDRAYQISVNRENYLPYNTTLNVNKASIENDILLDQEITEMPSFDPIYFNFDEFKVNPENQTTLNSIAETMQANPEASIKLSTYTDAIGTAMYNLALSEKRADSVIKYLVDKGVNAENIESKAYGKSQVVIDCNEGEDCKKASAKERRCEFVITTP